MVAKTGSQTLTRGSITELRGQELFDHVAKEKPRDVLELGFAHGLSSLYIAAAMEATGTGHITSIDNRTAAELRPTADELLQAAGLAHRVDFLFEATSYNWFLHRTLREHTKGGTTTPAYDFVFIDGAHTWVDDGFAFFLVDRLLRPGGQLLFDDLNWHMDERWPEVPEEERSLCQVGEVFNLLVMTHPSYEQVLVDSDWGWARKSVDAQPTVRTVYQRDVAGSVNQAMRRIRQRVRRRLAS
jgi:predicted O-methyltransferase YrrM